MKFSCDIEIVIIIFNFFFKKIMYYPSVVAVFWKVNSRSKHLEWENEEE